MFGRGKTPSKLFADIEHDALQEYHAILGRADNPEPSDYERIKELVQYLQITPEIAKRDIAVLKRLNQLQPVADRVDELPKEVNTAAQTLGKKEQELDAIERKMKDEIYQLRVQYGDADRLWRESLDARRERDELIEKNKRAMGTEWKKPTPRNSSSPIKPLAMPAK